MIDADKARSLAQLAAKRELMQCGDESALALAWKGLRRRDRQDKTLILAYAERAKALGHYEHAGKLLSGLLDAALDSDTLALYRDSNEAQRPKRILALEKRLKDHPSHPELLEALGFLYLDDRQYEKAQRCLEKVAEHKHASEVYMALGRLMDRQGNAAEAARYYRNALQFESNSPPQVLIESDQAQQ